MKKKMLTLFLIAYSTILLVGCGSKAEQQVMLRDQGIVLMEAGDYDGAVELFNQALDVSIGKVTELEIDIDYYKGAALFKAGKYDEACDVYDALIKYDKKNFKPYFLRGCIYLKNAEVSKACKDYDDAIAVDEKNHELYIEIFENMVSQGYSDQGYTYINKLLQLSDKSPEANYYKGRAYYMLGQYSDAEKLLKEANNKNITEAKLYLAKLYQDQGYTDSAQNLLQEYANSDGVNSEAMAALGDIEMSKGNFEEALNYYQTGMNLDVVDNLPELYKGQVIALENLRRFTEARDLLTQYVELYPDDEEASRELIFLKTR